MNEAAVDSGFYVTIEYGNNAPAFIFDTDGDPVWWATAPGSSSRARMDWNNKYMWMITGNPTNSGQGLIRRVSMDGTQVDDVPGTQGAHHDLAALPNGNMLVILHGEGQGACSRVMEIDNDFNMTPVIADVSTVYTPVMDCHPNSILYHDADASITLSDRNPNMYVKVDYMSGNVIWQFGGSNPKGDHIQASWQVNHGHHVLDNGNFLFFNNNGDGGVGASPVKEYSLDTSALTAQMVWSYDAGLSSFSLGDVQRLPGGNSLITYSNSGVIHEVDPSGNLVQEMTTAPLGYTIHRKSLYGPAPK